MSFKLQLAKPVLAAPVDTSCNDSCRSSYTNDSDINSCIELNCTAGGAPRSNPFDIIVQEPENLPQPLKDIGGIISTVVGAAILISAIAAFLYLIWGGLQWITSGGDKSALETARGRITAAIIGLVIVGAAWGIFKIIETVFGFTTILGGGS